MQRLVPLLCALCLLGATRPLAAEPPPPSRQALDTAIERGVAWLLEEQKPVGTWGSGKHALGKTALAVFTLLHCGLAEGQDTKASKRLARAYRYVDKTGAGRSKRRETDSRTYEASLLLMLLRARGRAADRDRMQRIATLLTKTQAPNGQWWYDGDGARHRSGGDNSNTQFATLALGQAHGEGLKIGSSTMPRALAWWVSSPGTKGGFGYASGGSPKSAATGSMTAAGIACMAIARTITGDGQARKDADHVSVTKAAQVQRAATDFLADVFSVTRNHGPAIDRKGQRQRHSGRGWLHYYLWTVERAMVLCGQEKLGNLDWYAAGAKHLLDTQKKDGSWRGEHPLYATCFALLFLTRAADRPRAFTPGPQPLEPGAPRGPTVTPHGKPQVPGPQQAHDKPSPEAPTPPPGTVLDWLQEPLAVGELPRRCRLAGPGSLLPLVRALRHPKAPVRQRAFEALRALLPDERTERVDRHPLPRGRLALWLRTNARHLRLVEGRFLL